MGVLQTETLSFDNRQGERLVGTLESWSSSSLASGAAPTAASDSLSFERPNRRWVCVMVHGVFVNGDWGFFPALSRAIARHCGVSVFRIDLSGYGRSGGAFEFGAYSKFADDVRAAVEALRARGFVVYALFGHSLGGSVVLHHSARYSSDADAIPIVINASARYHLREGLGLFETPAALHALETAGSLSVRKFGRAFTITRESLAERRATEMEPVVARIATAHRQRVRILTVHGSADEVVPYRDGETYHSRFTAIAAAARAPKLAGADTTVTAAAATTTTTAVTASGEFNPRASAGRLLIVKPHKHRRLIVGSNASAVSAYYSPAAAFAHQQTLLTAAAAAPPPPRPLFVPFHSFVTIKGADHSFTGAEHTNELARVVVEYLQHAARWWVAAGDTARAERFRTMLSAATPTATSVERQIRSKL